MRKKLAVSISILFLTLSGFGQQSAETEIRQVVNAVFEGMREGDSAKVHRSFRDDARFATSFIDRENNPAVESITLQIFLAEVGKPHKEVWKEELGTVEIRVDDNMAQVWATYHFYVDNTFSHCGVDALQLVKDENGWKILNIADTRRTGPCN